MSTAPPALQFQAAVRLGKLVSQGIVEQADCLPWLLVEAQRAGYSGDMSGLRAGLCWAMRDAADFWDRRRWVAEMAVRKAIWPLLDERTLPELVVRRAQVVNEQHHSALLAHEVRAVVREEVDWWVRRNSPRRRYVR